MISTFSAFFDANVFYGARLRSLMLSLAQTKLFRAKWSAQVHDEWTRNLLKNRPDLTLEALQKTKQCMDDAVLDALVTGYEPLIDRINLPDPDDRHVVAAALTCRASCIVTFNLSDFPPKNLDCYGLHVVHPDEFLLDVESLDTAAFAAAVREDFVHYQNPKLRFQDYVASLVAAGVPKAARQIQRLAVIIDQPMPDIE